MENKKPTNSLHNDKFKNIGLDTSFIQENATEYNDKISHLYNGGKKENTDISEVINRSASVKVVDTPVGQRVEPIVNYNQEQKMEAPAQNQTPAVNTAQVEAMMDQKVMGLAVKMQQYADETDNTIKALKQQIFALEEKVTKLHSQPTPAAEPQQKLAEPAVEEKKSTLEEDVSIDKMFNFSHNPSGNMNNNR